MHLAKKKIQHSFKKIQWSRCSCSTVWTDQNSGLRLVLSPQWPLSPSFLPQRSRQKELVPFRTLVAGSNTTKHQKHSAHNRTALSSGHGPAISVWGSTKPEVKWPSTWPSARLSTTCLCQQKSHEHPRRLLKSHQQKFKKKTYLWESTMKMLKISHHFQSTKFQGKNLEATRRNATVQ